MFTLAHLSDVHLPPMPWPRLRDIGLKRTLGLANWHRARKHIHRRDVLDALVADLNAQRPDHIAVGGDLVNIGLPAELAAAQHWLEQLGGRERVTVVPGNHDVYGGLGRDPGIERWRDYMRGETVAGADNGFPFVRRFDRIALIALSSAVQTPVFWASGRLGASQRQALATCLADLGRENHCRIVLLHHPPLPGQADRRRGLEDAPELAAILRQHGAELVLHGHNHRAMLDYLERPAGRVPIVGVPAASTLPGPHAIAARFNLFAIEPAGRNWQIAMTGRAYQAGGQLAVVQRTALTG